MSVIIDRREIWSCRDCGAPVDDSKVVDRICDELRARPETWEAALDDAHHATFSVTLAGACAACGGGRVICRLGEVRLA